MSDSRLYRASSRRAYHLLLRTTKLAFDVGTLVRAPDPCRHDPYRVLTVGPEQVTHLMRERLPRRLAGQSLPGDWDTDTMPLTETALYRGLRQRFAEGRDWVDTELHPARYRRRCDNEPPQYELYCEAEFLRRGEGLDRLYEDLTMKGYLSWRHREEPIGTEMTVTVTRDGVLARHSGGMHRLIMAQLQGLDSLTVRLFIIHAACVGTDLDPFRHERSPRSSPSGSEAAEE